MFDLPIVSESLFGLSDALQKNENTSVFGLSFGEKALFLCNQKRQIVYVAPNAISAIKMFEEMSSFGKNAKIILNTSTDFTSSKTVMTDSKKDIIDSLYALCKKQVDCLIISPQVFMQKYCKKQDFEKSILSLKLSQKIDIKSLTQNLIMFGYKKVDLVSARGEFSVKGDVVNIYDFLHEEPFKIDFFDDEIEAISHIDLETFKRIKELKNIDILPTGFFAPNIDEQQQKDIFEKIEFDYQKTLKTLDVNEQYKLKTSFEDFKINFENKNYFAIKNWLIPYLDCVSIEDYLNSDALIVFDDVKYIFDVITKEYSQIENTYNLLKNSGEILLSQKDYFISQNQVFNLSKTLLSFQQITSQNRIFNPSHVESYKSSLITNYFENYELLFEEIKYYLQFENTVLIFAGSEDLLKYLSNFLQSKGLNVNFCDEFKSENLAKNSVNISSKNIPYGAVFVEAKFVVIGTNELRKKREKKQVVSSASKEEFTLPKAGDYVVHESFGIALCEGVEKLKFSSYEKDYIILRYDGGDKLYLPTEQIGLISAYVSTGKAPKLNKLGTKDFENTKAKVKSKLKELAFDLISLYRDREDSKGYKFEFDKKMFNEFENSFPYEETADQQTAIDEIVDDMKHGKVMDRIVCGDVGYGKTEVALRASFLAVVNSKQVCFLCPTTILSQQHFNTAKSRLEKFGARVECLNRFKTKAEQKRILQDLKDGKIDVICGTHRLLSKDVIFKDLGLLVLDEEQRFGVGDKEKIKRLKTNVDVLTLSATPIPRTLHMGLVGIRDISIISTPPRDRLPVQTTVCEYSDALLLNAINRELSRDGQVLIIYNRVETIYEFLHHVRMLVGGDIPIGVAHGQMESGELEDQIMKLYNGETKILISTTLIENGIDLPSANTLVIIDADKLGLSQLYQLKGRVGRSKNLGYAYFTYQKNKVLNEDAYKRLNAIMEFTELGSGFKIAMKDLEIRGCGNILGAEQSGHMAKVGYDMYCKILSQAVSEIRGEKQREYKDIKLDVAVNCYIPENYIESSENRFRIYNNLKQIDTTEKQKKTLLEIEDLFGKVPDEIVNLSFVALLRNIAREFDVKRISIDRERCLAEFYEREKMLDKNIASSLKELGIKVYYSDGSIVMNFMLSEYSVKKKLELVCNVFENALDKKHKQKNKN